jgi:methyl-accepting chemotaxis protein
VNTTGLCNEIAEDISNVHDMAQEISNSSGELKVDADQLQQLSEELRRLVKNFKF